LRPCLLVNVCLLLVWCTVACALSRCRPLPVLPGVAHPPSAPSGVLRPKPLWGKVRSPICFFFYWQTTHHLMEEVHALLTCVAYQTTFLATEDVCRQIICAVINLNQSTLLPSRGAASFALVGGLVSGFFFWLSGLAISLRPCRCNYFATPILQHHACCTLRNNTDSSRG
jgi:hypothetical protein